MSLDLDTRQRAMLQEMGVRVWWPQADQIEEAAIAGAASIAAPEPLAPPAARPTTARANAPAIADQPGAAPTPAACERGQAIAQMDWQTLQQSVAGCRACALCETRKNTVFGVGQPIAPVDWLIIGEAPGENEDIQGEPFVGAAGKLLDNMLKAVGLDRHRPAEAGAAPVFIVNVLKCRPPGNRNPQASEIAQCEPYLARQIELLQPRVILALGRFAVQTLLAPSVPNVQSQPLGKLRGRVYRWSEVPVVVSYHPAYLLRSLPDKAKAWADMCLAIAALKGSAPRA